MASKVAEQQRRIVAILNVEDEDEAWVTYENLKRFLDYLKDNLELPCLLTGMEDFPWEEKYVFGYGDKDEYEKLKRTNPSYTDTFKLLEFEELRPNEGQIFVKVERVADRKKFSLPLDDLEASKRRSKNYQILEDYAAWWVNYQ